MMTSQTLVRVVILWMRHILDETKQLCFSSSVPSMSTVTASTLCRTNAGVQIEGGGAAGMVPVVALCLGHCLGVWEGGRGAGGTNVRDLCTLDLLTHYDRHAHTSKHFCTQQLDHTRHFALTHNIVRAHTQLVRYHPDYP